MNYNCISSISAMASSKRNALDFLMSESRKRVKQTVFEEKFLQCSKCDFRCASTQSYAGHWNAKTDLFHEGSPEYPAKATARKGKYLSEVAKAWKPPIGEDMLAMATTVKVDSLEQRRIARSKLRRGTYLKDEEERKRIIEDYDDYFGPKAEFIRKWNEEENQTVFLSKQKISFWRKAMENDE